jgi:ABC-2 type transport system ATP-binding protein
MDRRFGDARARRQLGFVPDAPVFFAGNALSALRFAAALNDQSPTREAMERVLTRVGLTEWKRDVRRFSRGMQQRLGLAQALVHAPKVLILDEPASALDPEGVLEVRTLLQELRAAGAAILLSSHQLSEVAMVSDRIAFLHEGRLLRYGRVDELLEATGEMEIVLRNFSPDAAFEAQWGAASDAAMWRVKAEEVQRFLESVWSRGAELVSVTPVRGDLTTLFLEWTKKEWTKAEDTKAEDTREKRSEGSRR